MGDSPSGTSLKNFLTHRLPLNRCSIELTVTRLTMRSRALSRWTRSSISFSLKDPMLSVCGCVCVRCVCVCTCVCVCVSVCVCVCVLGVWVCVRCVGVCVHVCCVYLILLHTCFCSESLTMCCTLRVINHVLYTQSH